jgi:hypothetical protein
MDKDPLFSDNTVDALILTGLSGEIDELISQLSIIKIHIMDILGN